MNPIELRQLKAQKLDLAGKLVDQDDLNEDTRQRIDVLISEAKVHEEDARRLEQLEAFQSVSKPAGYGDGVQAPAYHQRRTADKPESIYLRWLRSGDEGAQRESNAAAASEYRASNNTDMNITTAADGGDLVPTGHFQGIIAKARPQLLYPRLGIRMIPGMGTTVNVPVDNEADSGEFVSTSESSEFDRDAPAVSKVAMTLVKYTKRQDITNELLEDEDSRVLDFLNTYVAEGMAATMNKLLVTEVLASGTAGLTLDSATAIGAAEVPELLYKLSAEYAAGASVAWLMRRSTEGYLRGIYGSSQFAYGSSAGPATGNGQDVASTLWGIPAYSNDNMGALSASGKSLLIGNFNYMGMRMAPAMTVLRDPYSRAAYGEIRLHYYFRTVFKVLQAGAFQYATHPTA